MLHQPGLLLLLVAVIATTSDRTAHGDTVLDLRNCRSLDSHSQIQRDANRLTIRLEDKACESVLIPRLYAALRSESSTRADSGQPLTVHPETSHWVIRRTEGLIQASAINLLFDTRPQLASEIDPICQLGDGRLDLHAYQAQTTGEKLRYEPQAHKNTVGYWVNPADFATWDVQVERPGKFNVGILQGCGADQGGSVALLSIRDGDRTVEQLEFTVAETGHFQNFVWRTVGVIEISAAGNYIVRLQPKTIKKAALMDVRQIQLVLLP